MSNEESVTDFINFLTDSYKPITICATAKVWRQLDYKNELFSAFIVPQYAHYCEYPKAYTQEPILCIKPKGFVHPAVLPGELLGVYKNLTFIDIHGNPINIFTVDEDTEAYVLTEGTVVNRFIRMICDFGLKKGARILEYDFNGVHQEYVISRKSINDWNDLIRKLPPNSIDYLIQLSRNISHLRFLGSTLKVTRSPYYDHNKYAPKAECDSQIFKEFMKQTWYTNDGNMSVPADIFTKECAKYASYYNTQPFSRLYKCEGGLSCTINSPWIKHMQKSYVEVVGRSSYGVSSHFSYEELVVFAEALKDQSAGVEFTNRINE